MVYRLPAVAPYIKDEAVPVRRETPVVGEFVGGGNHAPEHLCVVWAERRRVFYVNPGYNQYVFGRLRVYVGESDDGVVFVQNVGGRFARSYLAENAIRHIKPLETVFNHTKYESATWKKDYESTVNRLPVAYVSRI
jgi:hypothetical protein